MVLPIALLLAACDGLPGKPTPAERPLRPSEVIDFATLYGRNCAGCHGPDGLLGGALPMNDPVYLAVAGRDRIIRLTAEGVPGTTMPGFAASAGGTLTGQQIEILADGMIGRWGARGLRASQLPPYAASAPGSADSGAQVYATRCAECHGADGGGGPRGGSVVDGAYLGLVSEQALRLAVICGRPDLGMPAWRGRGTDTPMTDDEITDVVAWLVSKRPRFP
ncbi:MAG TPA: c-type cytochrome [Candidatus Dormibacteraeota bacterium]|nr:c-type cytochrome [Candidatus Dormibacteraeota bacterium]